ncbi:MAG: glycerate kinase [Halolamina sp.]
MFDDADRPRTDERTRTALACLEAGIEAAHPRTVVRDVVRLDGDGGGGDDGDDSDGETLHVRDRAYDLDAYDEVVVLGGGNAAGHVAAALESVLGERLDGGVVVTDDPVDTDRVDVREGDHPVPSRRGVAGARAVLESAGAAGEETLVLAVVTGGGSALLPAPAGEVTLSELRATTDALLESGATIHEINAVRKRCSALKGGRLALEAAPATVAGLVLSDVVGNDHSVVASGPTAPDDSTTETARSVLDRYDVDAPSGVTDRLERTAAGAVPETPGADHPAFDRVENHLLADGFVAIDAAAAAAADRGYETLVLSSRVRGSAREAATTHAAVAEEIEATGNPVAPPAVVLSGGETTVAVDGAGEGGPNQEFALGAALDLDAERTTVAAVDTDGIDGATDAAGAVVDGSTVDSRAAVADARAALADNDAYPLLAAEGALLDTGPTGTNVNDLRVVVVGEPSG